MRFVVSQVLRRGGRDLGHPLCLLYSLLLLLLLLHLLEIDERDGGFGRLLGALD